jgi:hypothetical protein
MQIPNRESKEKTRLESCYHEWISNNFVSLSIPKGFTHRGIVEQVAKGAHKPIPIAYLSDVLDGAVTPRGSVVFGSPRRFLDGMAMFYGLGWWITEKGLWMAHHPPTDVAYIRANGSMPLIQPRGRPRERSADFVARAGELWNQALAQSREKGLKNVPYEQLGKIASELDDLNFVPPADFMEKSDAREIRKFNTAHSNSKGGSIKTWSKLVGNKNGKHLRAMRRLLSRCGSELPASLVRKMIPEKIFRPTYW